MVHYRHASSRLNIPTEIRKLEASTGESARQIKTEALGTNKSIAQYNPY